MHGPHAVLWIQSPRHHEAPQFVFRIGNWFHVCCIGFLVQLNLFLWRLFFSSVAPVFELHYHYKIFPAQSKEPGLGGLHGPLRVGLRQVWGEGNKLVVDQRLLGSVVLSLPSPREQGALFAHQKRVYIQR